jgi:rod shape determining protein RodA
MIFNAAQWRRFDWLLLAIVFILCLFGLAAVYSVDLSRGDELSFFPTQLLAVVTGMIVLFISASLHLNIYQNYTRLFYLFGLVLLAAVLFFGVEVRGTKGWFRFGQMSFQPVEFVKFGLVCFLSWLIARYGRRFDRLQFVITSGLATALPVALVLLEPDLGSALVLVLLWFGLLVFAGIKKRYLVTVVFFFIIFLVSAWLLVFQDYQKDRLLTFVNPGRDPLGAGYNVTQSIIAIGSGGFWGRGLGFGSQSQLHFLPEAQTDFIFSVVSEELGFVGSFVMVVLFFLLLRRLLRIARLSNSEFGSYLVTGCALIFLIQMLFNLGGALGLLPITGVTLPFVSYGGSSLVMSCFLIGLAMSVAKSTIPPGSR